MRKIANLLEPQIFLENDYIVFKGDIGEEMYFNVNGEVDILSKNEETVLKSLP